MNDDRPDPPAVHPEGSGPDLEALAGYDLDLTFPRERAPDAPTDAHVAACTECTALLAVLRGVADEVRGLVPPMPADLAPRLAATLAAQPPAGALPAAPERATSPVSSLVGRHRSTSEVEPPAVRRGRVVRAIAGLAAGLLVFGGGAWLVADIGGGGADSVSTADGPAAVDAERAAEGGDSAGEAVPDFDRQTLTAAVPSLLGTQESAPQPQSGPETAGVPDDNGVTATTPSCLARVPVATAQALSIVTASYDGVPALILLFAAEPGSVQVTVVSDCSDGSIPMVLDQFTAPL